MGIEEIIKNPYIISLGFSVFIVGFDIIYFLEKVKEKIKSKKDELLNSFQEKFKDNYIKAQDVVYIYHNLNKNEDELIKAKNSIDSSLWSGIGIIISCILGYISSSVQFISSDFVLSLLFISGAIFVLSFVILFHWYTKN